MCDGCSVILQSTVDDVVTERETYQTSREGLEQMYSECQKRLKDEIRARQVSPLSEWHQFNGGSSRYSNNPVIYCL